MPTIFLDRIPLPNLKLYTTISILLVSGCLYYAINTTSDPYWKLQYNSTTTTVNNLNHHPPLTLPTLQSSSDPNIIELSSSTIDEENDANNISKLDNNNNNNNNKNDDKLIEDKWKIIEENIKNNHQNNDNENDINKNGSESRTFISHVKDITIFMSQEPVCIWTLINMAYCCLILLGKSIQKIVFGDLRISEQQHLKDKFWNFIFYKFIFVFGVVNVQFLHEVVLWVSWFSILGFLHLLSQLCKDRFEYLSFSPTTPGWSHFRLIGLLTSILTISGLMFIICAFVGFFGGFNTFAFMAAECILLTIRTLHVLVRYAMFLYDMRQGGISNEVSWDKRGPVSYYIELVFDCAALFVDLVHHLHMLFWSNIFLSMASLVIVMQLRYLSNEIQRRFKKHRNYLWVLNHMEKSYPLATSEDLSQNSDNCAICWEKMETARKLPCSHLFHNSCLQSWLEQDTSCPTCRLGLSVQNHANLNVNIDRIDETENNGRATNNHFFHFNGSRYVSWLPNFSVEVTHINAAIRTAQQQQATAAHTSQLRNMSRQIQQMFPRYPLSTIIADLHLSRSMEITIDNILEGRLQIPPRFQNEMEEEEFSNDPNNNNNNNNNNDNHMNGLRNGVRTSISGRLNTENTTRIESNVNNNNNNLNYLNSQDQRPSTSTSPLSTSLSSSSSSASLVNTINSSSTTNDYYIQNLTVPHTDNNYSNNSNVSLSDSGYEIERNSNIFGNQNELLRDDSLEDIPLGDRFSKSSLEREKILQRRKEMLLAVARKRYIEKNKSELNIPASDVVRHRTKNSIQ